MIRRSMYACCMMIVALWVGTMNTDSQGREDAPKIYKLEELNKTEQFVCGWKPGTDDEALKAIKDLGLEVVLVSEGEPGFVICKAKGGLKQETLNKLREIKAIRYVEPDYPIEMSENPGKPIEVNLAKDDKRDASPIDEVTLAAFNKIGRMACKWEPKQGDEAVKAVKKLGLIIDLRDDDSDLLICKWKGDLKKETLEALNKEDSIRYIEPDPDVNIQPVGLKANPVAIPLMKAPKVGQSVCRPNDPGYGQLYGMELIRASNAWCRFQISPVIVAIIDSGIDSKHEDLRDNVRVELGIDFIRVNADGQPTKDPQDENGHGTHVAGTIGAVGNNGVGVTGVCWRVQLVSLRVFDKDGKGGSNARIAAAIKAAVKMKAKVVNMSLGGRGDSQSLREAVELADKEKVLLVCAAGNLSKEDRELDNDKVPEFPASYKNANVIAVAAVGKDSLLADFSHFGRTTVHLAGPGVEILSTIPGSKYGKLSGTSMATPHVTGAAALILGSDAHKNKDAVELKKVILDNARKTAGLENKCITGAILDIGFIAPESNPPIVKDPPPPVYIYYPPPCQCPQRPLFRIFRRCR